MVDISPVRSGVVLMPHREWNHASMLSRNIAVATCTAVILVLTLTPVTASKNTPADWINVRGAADAIANVLLFVPFGFAVALRFRGRSVPVLWAAALTISIELAQLAIPGRYSSVSDVVFNTLGGAAGGALVHRADAWLRPGGVLRWLLPGAAVAGAGSVLMATAVLFQPNVPQLRLYGQWTPEFADMARYEGRVVAASVGTIPVRSALVAASADLRRNLLRGDTVEVDVLAGPPPPSLAPIFSIFDEHARDIFLIGADGRDAVIRIRSLAAPARLDHRDLRVAGAFSTVDRGEPFRIRFYRQSPGYCLTVNRSRWCGLGLTLGDGWALVHSPVPNVFAGLLPFIWVGLLMVPAGFWARTRRAGFVAALVVFATLALTPGPARILPTPPLHYVAALAGLCLGAWLGRSAERFGRPTGAER